MAKKNVDENVRLIKQKVQEGNAAIGTNQVLKALQESTTKKVYLAANCPQDAREEIEHYANLTGAEIIVLDQSNEEIGALCKKNFFIAALAILGE